MKDCFGSVSIYREVASPSWLAGPRGVRSVKEAAEQDKWEGSGRWLQIWKGERKNEGALSAGDVSVLSLPPRLVVLELGSLYNLQRAFQPIYAHFLTTSTALFFLLLSEFL